MRLFALRAGGRNRCSGIVSPFVRAYTATAALYRSVCVTGKKRYAYIPFGIGRSMGL